MRVRKLNEADARAQSVADKAAQAAREWSEKNIADGGVCDFCCDLLVPGHYVTYVADSLVSSLSMLGDDGGAGTVTVLDDPFWAACEKCDPVVAERDPAKLADHVLAARNVERVGEIPSEILPRIRADLVDLYAKFFEGNLRREDSR